MTLAYKPFTSLAPQVDLRGRPTSTPKPATSLVGSVTDYPGNRQTRWGSNRYRGNCDGRLFRDLVLHYKAQSVADPMIGSGTTRDCIAEMNNQSPDIHYWGGDLNHGFNLLTDDIPGKYDLVWIHPPYWNLIVYSKRDADLSAAPSYEVFLERLEICLSKCAKALKPGGRLAVLIGDMHRDGKFYPMGRDVMKMPLGELRSIIVNPYKNCWSDIFPPKGGYAPREDLRVTHDTCFIFKNTGGA